VLNSLVQSLLHGSEKAKREGDLDDKQSHSTSVARGRYVHEIIKHHVKPGSTVEYRDKMCVRVRPLHSFRLTLVRLQWGTV
jgi:hypothetical protein